MLGAWSERPSELQALFNPAFTAALLCVAVRAFEKDAHAKGRGMPFLMANFILPLSLHTETRKSFPQTTQTSIVHWISSTPKIYIGLLGRVTGLRSVTCEGIRFGVAGKILAITNDGELIHVPRRPRGLTSLGESSAEVAECVKASEMLGHWFARVPDLAFLLQLLKVNQ